MRANWLTLLIGASLASCAAAGEALSSDFLEFLGDGSQLDGQWLDPLSLHESPEVFAALTEAKHDAAQGKDGATREASGPAKAATTPPPTADGGNKHD